MFVLPIGSTSVVSRRPWTTLALMGICVAVFAATAFERPPSLEGELERLDEELDENPWLMDDALTPDLPTAEVAARREHFAQRVSSVVDRAGGLERKLALVPARGVGQLGWLTNLFVHFGLLHLLGNLLFLWIVGPLLEEAWGSARFGLFYLLAGLVASATQFLLSRHSFAAIGGASGAIAGCMGAFAVRFALSRIRFIYFFWLIRPFWGSFHLPAWTAGFFWFGRELFDLKDGGATGVATGAHVGGFAIGAAIALGMKALGWERAFQTVSESAEEQEAQAAQFARASSAMRAGDFEGAHAELKALLAVNPSFDGATSLLAEAEVRSRRGAARLEKLLRPQLKKQGSTVEATLLRLWDDLEVVGLSDGFLWELVERLGPTPNVKYDRLRTAALERLAKGTGRHAIEARKRLAAAPASFERGLDLGLEQRSHSTTDTGGAERLSDDAPQAGVALVAEAGGPSEPTSPARPIDGVEAHPSVEARAVVLPATFHSITAEELTLLVEGKLRVVPFRALAGIEAAVVPLEGRNELLVDLVLATPPRVPPACLRLSGADSQVPALFPDRSPPQAWDAFITGLRRRLSPGDVRPSWASLPSPGHLTASWSRHA